MTHFQRTAAWLKACGKEPGNEALSLQIGCHLEEVCELLECLRISGNGWQRVLERATQDLNDLADELKSGTKIAHFPVHLREPVLDALCDAEVTGNGIAYIAGFQKDGADEAVLTSNESKLEDGKPVLLPGGKIGKGKNYQKPNVRAFI